MTELLDNERSFWRTVGLGIITFGVYFLIVRNRMANEVNLVCKKDRRHTARLPAQIIAGIFTLGIYFFIVWPMAIIERREEYLIINHKLRIIYASKYIVGVLVLLPLTLGIYGFYLLYLQIKQHNSMCSVYNATILKMSSLDKKSLHRSPKENQLPTDPIKDQTNKLSSSLSLTKKERVFLLRTEQPVEKKTTEDERKIIFKK